MHRRHLLMAGSALLASPARPALALPQPGFAPPHAPAAMRANPDRIIDIAVGIRPFRARARASTLNGCMARPQPEVDYALIYRGHNLVVLPRRDGLLVAAMGDHDFGNADLTPDRGQSEAAVQRLARLF